MNPRHHVRTGSLGRKQAPAHHNRPAKPLAPRRGQSYNNVHAQSTSQAHGSGQSTPRSTSFSRRSSSTAEGSLGEGEEGDMMCFSQFCATCEKQIVTPGNSILYCSEACRKKDVSNPSNLQAPHSPPLSPSATSYLDYPITNIIPQRSPTILRPLSLVFSDLSISGDAADRSEEITTTAVNGRGSDSNLPSLVHSPSSSYSTVASNASYRPLPPRHSNPFSASFSTTKSIDLVLPYPVTAPSSPPQWLKDSSLKSCASTLTSFRVCDAGELSYERRKVGVSPDKATK